MVREKMRHVLLFALVAAGLVSAIALYHTRSLNSASQSASLDERVGSSREEYENMSAREPPRPGPVSKPPPAPTPSEESFISCQAGGTTAPSFFPWPPPQGSDEQDFTEAVVSAIRQTVKGPLRLNSVDLFLKDRLRRVGHSSFTYFSTPRREGYAAIIRLGRSF